MGFSGLDGCPWARVAGALMIPAWFSSCCSTEGAVWVIPTDEKGVIAGHTLAVGRSLMDR